MDFVVVDEAHYLNDPDRGVVWEEVLIYLPPRVRVLLLSATVGNPEEICRWLESNRGRPCELVEETRRPVPLHPLFLYPEAKVGLFAGKKGLTKPMRNFLKEHAIRTGRRIRVPRWDVSDIVEGLRKLKLLPAIFFLKSRADCDAGVESFGARPSKSENMEEMREVLEPHLEEYPHLREHKHLNNLMRYRVTSHHAGQIPQWKLLIEQLMNKGMLDAIFSTSTVAAGVDFPARTVVVLQSDRFNGRGFAPLTATELRQMTGRAGRRGKDRVGFALFVPGPHLDIPLLAHLLRSGPDDIVSQIQINFSMVLNLLLSYKPEEISRLLQNSLAAFQQGWDGKERDDGEPFDSSYAPARESGSMRSRNRSPNSRDPLADPLGRMSPGRLFVHKDGSVYLAFFKNERRGKILWMSHRLGKKLRIRKGRLVLRGIHPEKIARPLEKTVDLPGPDANLVEIQNLWDDLEENFHEIATLESPDEPEADPFAGADEYAVEGGSWLWEDFVKHLLFLKRTGYVDDKDSLTPEGRWASRLRLDHPVVVSEAIRKGIFNELNPRVLAGLLAPFVTDKDREVPISGADMSEIEGAFDALTTGTYEIRRDMELWGFNVPYFQFWPAAVLYLWAGGTDWERLIRTAPMDEGDLVSVILRTSDHLRQLGDLKDTHPALARIAWQALRSIERDPVIFT